MKGDTFHTKVVGFTPYWVAWSYREWLSSAFVDFYFYQFWLFLKKNFSNTIKHYTYNIQGSSKYKIEKQDRSDNDYKTWTPKTAENSIKSKSMGIFFYREVWAPVKLHIWWSNDYQKYWCNHKKIKKYELNLNTQTLAASSPGTWVIPLEEMECNLFRDFNF